MWTPRTLTEAKLTRWGREIGKTAAAPLFLTLRGPLGAGKSVLARAVCQGAGVPGPIPSPTFNLLYRYPARGGREVVHLDLFRIENPTELRELGWDELGAPSEIVLVEWPERAGDRLPTDRWDVEIQPVTDAPEFREVRVTRVGAPHPLPALPGPALDPREA